MRCGQQRSGAPHGRVALTLPTAMRARPEGWRTCVPTTARREKADPSEDDPPGTGHVAAWGTPQRRLGVRCAIGTQDGGRASRPLSSFSLPLRGRGLLPLLSVLMVVAGTSLTYDCAGLSMMTIQCSTAGAEETRSLKLRREGLQCVPVVVIKGSPTPSPILPSALSLFPIKKGHGRFSGNTTVALWPVDPVRLHG